MTSHLTDPTKAGLHRWHTSSFGGKKNKNKTKLVSLPIILKKIEVQQTVDPHPGTITSEIIIDQM